MSLRTVITCLLLVTAIHAAELTHLAPGLGYCRVHALSDAVPALQGRDALILDLRRATMEPAALANFTAALKERPMDSRLYVLVGPETPAEIADAVSASPGRALTLGVAGAHPAPRIVVAQAAEEDARAYQAAETGLAIDELISGKIEKDHFDEAALVREFKNGNHDARPGQGDPNGEAKPAVRPVDRVLQRAVQLHRALLALHR